MSCRLALCWSPSRVPPDLRAHDPEAGLVQGLLQGERAAVDLHGGERGRSRFLLYAGGFHEFSNFWGSWHATLEGFIKCFAFYSLCSIWSLFCQAYLVFSLILFRTYFWHFCQWMNSFASLPSILPPLSRRRLYGRHARHLGQALERALDHGALETERKGE